MFLCTVTLLNNHHFSLGFRNQDATSCTAFVGLVQAGCSQKTKDSQQLYKLFLFFKKKMLEQMDDLLGLLFIPLVNSRYLSK